MTMRPDRVIALLWFVWWVTWMLAAIWRGRTIKQLAAGRQVSYRVILMIGVVMLINGSPRESRGVLWQTGTAVGWSLVVVAALGLAFTWWARIHLGRLWSATVTRRQDHRIVDTGPYAWVRHPIYTGIIIASFATATLLGTIVAFVGASIMTYSWYIKARLEETFLREQLGAASYDAYALRVPMLFPRPVRPR